MTEAEREQELVEKYGPDLYGLSVRLENSRQYLSGLDAVNIAGKSTLEVAELRLVAENARQRNKALESEFEEAMKRWMLRGEPKQTNIVQPWLRRGGLKLPFA